MNNKKKQTAVVAMATVLSVTTIASPMAVMAQENAPAPSAIIQEEKQQQKTAPDIVLPENLQATAGMALEEISLPEHWTWVENSTVITEETAEYPARFSVDDVTYDYSNAEGYNAKEHYVERMVAVTVEPEKLEQAEPVQGKANKLLKDTPTILKAGDIVINEANFPDEEFRDYVIASFDTDKDRELSTTEIAGITKITVARNAKIKDLTGIKYFTALTELYCSGTGITNLDVSNNTALTYLDCSYTGITNLDVSNNTALTYLDCSFTGITNNLDVSKNTALTYLDCYNTGITGLDVSNNIALTYLDCSYTGVTSLDVNNNTALTKLYCYNTGITRLDVSNNTALTILRCEETGITNLDISNNTALTELYCNKTGITSLDVSNNTALTTLNCSKTGITSLDVSNNTALASLHCYETGITSLDVSNNTALTTLMCYSTGITSLDVSNNTALNWLECYNTGITSLNVSNTKVLERLECGDTPLAYLNIGTNNSLYRIEKVNLKPVNVEVTDSFNMADIFADIDINKISSVKGATYSNGVMSDYSIGKPITYTYACGTSSGGKEQTIDVTLNLIAKSTISITENLNKAYDGNAVSATPIVDRAGSSGAVSYKWEQKKNDKWDDIASAPTDVGTYRVTATLASDNEYPEATSAPVEFTISQADSTIAITADLSKAYDGKAVNDTPAINKTGSKGAVSYKWERKKNDTDWEDIASAPTDAGTYRVTATLASDSNYKGEISVPVEFIISQATNSWIDTLSITGWTYGSTENKPTAIVKFGTVGYLYSDSENGTYTDTVPINAGTWYVKATIAGTDNYTGLESIKAFKIMKAKDTWLEEPAILDWVFGGATNKPTAKAKSGGTVSFTYSSSENGTYTDKVPTTAGTWYMKATVAESNNYIGLETILAFTIAPKNAENNSQIVISDISSDKDVENLVIKDEDKVLEKGTDYDVDKKQNGNKVSVTIEFKGNYAGTITKAYTVASDKPKDEPKDTGSVQTGDINSVGLWSSLLAFSAGIALFLKRKKQKEETEE